MPYENIEFLHLSQAEQKRRGGLCIQCLKMKTLAGPPMVCADCGLSCAWSTGSSTTSSSVQNMSKSDARCLFCLEAIKMIKEQEMEQTFQTCHECKQQCQFDHPYQNDLKICIICDI